MTEAQFKAMFEMLIKIMSNQSLIMLSLSTMAEHEKARNALHDQAMKIVEENEEALEYIRATKQ